MPETPKMNGQWIGRYEGTQQGQIIVNIDERQSGFEASASIIDDNAALPIAVASFTTTTKDRDFQCQATVLALNPRTIKVATWKDVQQLFPAGAKISQVADAHVTLDNDTLKLSWKTDIGLEGEAALPRSKATAASELVPTEMTWDSFKAHVTDDDWDNGRFLFRGQNEPRRLRTAFHRLGRADLLRFMREDIPMLHRNLTARTKHVFNLEIPNENGAFLHLIQHHGYPTPLLDWTYSPYVAAFFAYRKICNAKADKASPDAKVRIFVLDQRQWGSDFLPLPWLDPAHLHFSVLEFLAIENERMVPQQAASTVTNIDDIETYIRSKDSTGEKKYLSAIDLPLRERRRVMQDLSVMGITAGSLFPGLDGACEALKQRNFDL